MATKWTLGRKKAFITSVIRGGFRRWPAKYDALKDAKAGKKINPKTNREAMHYTCNGCKQDYPAKDVQVDHIDPVVCLKDGFVDWDTYIQRMYVEKEKLQVLCKDCHQKKSSMERSKRKNNGRRSKSERTGLGGDCLEHGDQRTYCSEHDDWVCP